MFNNTGTYRFKKINTKCISNRKYKMKTVKIKVSEEQLQNLKKIKEESKRKIRESLPPKEIMEWINKNAEKTNKLNKGK